MDTLRLGNDDLISEDVEHELMVISDKRGDALSTMTVDQAQQLSDWIRAWIREREAM